MEKFATLPTNGPTCILMGRGRVVYVQDDGSYHIYDANIIDDLFRSLDDAEKLQSKPVFLKK